MSVYEWSSLVLEFFVLVILLLERYRGRPDIVIKNEIKQRRRLNGKPGFDNLTVGEMK